MSDGSRLIVCNVGHGLAVLLDDQGKVSLFDTGKSPEILRLVNAVLLERGQRQLELLLLTHLDRDHAYQAPQLIAQNDPGITPGIPCFVKTLAFNRENRREGSLDRIRRALEAQSVTGGKTIKVVDNDPDNEIARHLNEVTVGLSAQILHPRADSPYAAGKGTYNANSVVVKFGIKGGSDAYESVLVPSDNDEKTLAAIDPIWRPRFESRILVFPHHGGKGAGDNVRFAKELLKLVNPEIVIVSNGRNEYGNPRPEVLDAIRATRIRTLLCTQLNQACCTKTVASRPPPHRLFKIGEYEDPSSESCAGSIEILATNKGFELHKRHDHHFEFIHNKEVVSNCQCCGFNHSARALVRTAAAGVASSSPT